MAVFLLSIYIEPTNNVAPKVAGRRIDGSIVQDVVISKSAIITCEVTGYPVPLFRYIIGIMAVKL